MSGCFFSKEPFYFPNTISNLTETNYTIGNTIGFSSSYSIGGFEKIVLYPKTTGGIYGNGFGNQNQAPVTIFLNPDRNEFNGSIEQLSTHLKGVFEAITDPETGENILSNVELLSQTNANNTDNIDVSLNFRIIKNLNESYYRMSLETNSNAITNPWKKLNFSISYDLDTYIVDNVAVVQGNAEVYQNTIEVRENYNQIQFIPYYDGVYDVDGYNTITITIPTSSSIGANYTRDALIAEINYQLNQNSLTKNSVMSLFNIGQKQYSKLRLNLNKTFTSKDFKLVFYDAISFSYCGVGTTGGRSIRTVTWDSTLGWLLGYHSYTEYVLEDFTYITADNLIDQNYKYNLYNSGDLTDPYTYSWQPATEK